MWKMILAIVVVLGLGVTVLLPSLCRSSETGNRAKCASNLHQIGLAILLYTEDHGGRYPDSLAELMTEEQLTAETVTCPSSDDERADGPTPAAVFGEVAAAEAGAAGHKHCLSYVYVGRGLTKETVTAVTLVAYEPVANHDGAGFNALFGDGHAEFFSPPFWPKVAKEGGLSDAAIAAGAAATMTPHR